MIPFIIAGINYAKESSVKLKEVAVMRVVTLLLSVLRRNCANDHKRSGGLVRKARYILSKVVRAIIIRAGLRIMFQRDESG